MTTNQIAYNKHLEEKRHNLVTESHEAQDVISRQITAQAASSQAATAANRLTEDQRANREKERVNWFNAQETARHNLRLEDLSQYSTDKSTAETRYRTDTEARLKEVDQQLKREEIGVESHKAQSQRISSLASELAARASMFNANTNKQNLAELIRHNTEVESETKRSNMNSELIRALNQAENVRHNVQQESLNAERNTNDYTLGQRQQDTNAENAISNRISALAAEKNAATNRGAAYAEGFKDVAFGVSQAADAATTIFNLVKGVQSNAKQKAFRKAWFETD